MKKSILSILLVFCLLSGLTILASAETYYGGDDWSVTFTADEKMVSTFSSNELSDGAAGLQPGDNIIFNLALTNSHTATTDWYMTNEVLSSLEDASKTASGGGYTYILTYEGPGGNKVLFDSDTVGGEGVSEAGEGLHEATDALKDYFYLDTLNNGQSGHIRLEVALDGETQGNSYQDTLAKLQMNFAVELGSETPTTPSPSASITPTPSPTKTPTPTTPRTTPTPTNVQVVKTGDETNLVPYFIAMGVSGVLLLVLAIVSLKKRRKGDA